MSSTDIPSKRALAGKHETPYSPPQKRRDDREHRRHSKDDRSRYSSQSHSMEERPSEGSRERRSGIGRDREQDGRQIYRDARDRDRDYYQGREDYRHRDRIIGHDSHQKSHKGYRRDDRPREDRSSRSEALHIESDKPPNEKKGGLDIEIHPLLRDPNAEFTFGKVPLAPKATVSSSKANIRAGVRASTIQRSKNRSLAAESLELPPDISKNNPYFDPDIGVAAVKPRAARPLVFNQKGKYVAQANQMRSAAQLEQLRKEVAESTMKAGLDVEIVADLLTGLETVPTVEWWDAPFLPEGYGGRISQDLVTNLIQRPPLIPPPIDPASAAPVKPLMLTKEERKKMRRQRRLEEQREEQEKIRVGLLPSKPSKAKIASLVHILGLESVQDPTEVESRVKKEVEQRQALHDSSNAQRKLTDEERRAKRRQKLCENTSTCVSVAVFRIGNLEANSQWQFKLSVNAEQSYLSGCALMHPEVNIVIVEGGPKGIRRYKHLLLDRIDWNSPGANVVDASSIPTFQNKCVLVWEGIDKQRHFEKFKVIKMETEYDARELLSEAGIEHYWKLARNFIT